MMDVCNVKSGCDADTSTSFWIPLHDMGVVGVTRRYQLLSNTSGCHSRPSAAAVIVFSSAPPPYVMVVFSILFEEF